jgi:hypothetical protein
MNFLYIEECQRLADEEEAEFGNRGQVPLDFDPADYFPVEEVFDFDGEPLSRDFSEFNEEYEAMLSYCEQELTDTYTLVVHEGSSEEGLPF